MGKTSVYDKILTQKAQTEQNTGTEEA